MKFILLGFIILSNLAYSQHLFTFSGYVVDEQNGEAIIGATIADSSLNYAVTSNDYGFFSLTIPAGEHQFFCSFIGYEILNFTLKLDKNIIKTIKLNQGVILLNQVTITADNLHDKINQNNFNVEKITIQSIKHQPAIFGEIDIIKSVQNQTGVKTIGDGSSAMYIRGGNSDQNLILIDEAPIYNPSHLFGLVSVFNPDAINHVSLFKSNMPAQYGGRVSAVLDCKLKEGSTKNYNFSTGISPMTVILTADGPIIKDKSSFLVSARRSWLDSFVKLGTMVDMLPSFYDLNFKINTQVGEKNRIFFSFYNGKDELKATDGFYNIWGNSTATLRWNSMINARLFSNFSIVASDYKNSLEYNEEMQKYKWLTGVTDLNAKLDFSFYIKPESVLKFGISSIYHKFTPGESEKAQFSISRIQAWENSIYIVHDVSISKSLGLNYGLRLSSFQNTGYANWYSFDINYNPISMHENHHGIYNSYYNPEPRITLNYKFKQNSSIKMSYARNAQYMPVLQNNSLSYTSIETWFPATKNTKPILADSYAIGWFLNINQKISLSIESYYKNYYNQIDFVDHAMIINNPLIEAEIRTGKAYAYGSEFLIKYNGKNCGGSIAYNYSRAFRIIDGINKGEKFSSNFDIPHDIRFSSYVNLNKKWTFSTAWTYMSGRPVTLPIGFYYESGFPVPIFSDRNSSRLPDYHRMDIAFNYSNKSNDKKTYFDINLGIYNIYARRNPIGYYFSRPLIANDGIEGYQYILFTILPNFSIKYNF